MHSPTPSGESRRTFLRAGAGFSAAAVTGSFHALWQRTALGNARPASPGYGKLMPVKDEATGLPLIQLPEGFRYITYGWIGDPLDNGAPTPSAHDGMAVIRSEGNLLTLCRQGQ